MIVNVTRLHYSSLLIWPGQGEEFAFLAIWGPRTKLKGPKDICIVVTVDPTVIYYNIIIYQK
jgi:hypothetical protein